MPTYRGWLKPDDPIFKEGWTFITGSNLNPEWMKQQAEKRKRDEERKARRSRKPPEGQPE